MLELANNQRRRGSGEGGGSSDGADCGGAAEGDGDDGDGDGDPVTDGADVMIKADAVAARLKGAEVLVALAGVVVMNVPVATQLSSLFTTLEELRCTGVVLRYTVNQASLEQVFLRIAEASLGQGMLCVGLGILRGWDPCGPRPPLTHTPPSSSRPKPRSRGRSPPRPDSQT